MLAASGDPYQIDGKRSEGEPIDPTVAISAQVTEELDANVPNVGPKHVAKNEVAKVLQHKLDDIDYKSGKLTAARAFGLSTVYFSGSELDRLKNETDDAGNSVQALVEQQNKASGLGLTILQASNVLEALDGVLLTNRYLKKMQEKIQQEWLRPWKAGTAEFEPARLAGRTSDEA